MLEPRHIVQRKTKKILTGSNAVGASVGAAVVGLALGAVVGLALGAVVGLNVVLVVEVTALLVNPLTQVTPRATKAYKGFEYIILLLTGGLLK